MPRRLTRRLLARVPVRRVTVTTGFALVAPVLFGSALVGSHTPHLAGAIANPLEEIALQPQADWFGEGNQDVKGDVAARVREVRSGGAVPVLVAYDIPARDCGQDSKGGAADAKAYHRWIQGFADGLGNAKAIVILEPDALAGADCLSPAARDQRLAMIRDAVETLKSKSGARVYVDAGNPRWKSVPEIAARLESAGIDRADGFSLNVSNTVATQANLEYGRRVSAAVGDAHFVIDTSRGVASRGEWCNPVGRALGLKPTTDTGDALVDAFLWIKRPGESDGACNGGPAAGKWRPAYALALASVTRGV